MKVKCDSVDENCYSNCKIKDFVDYDSLPIHTKIGRCCYKLGIKITSNGTMWGNRTQIDFIKQDEES